MNKMGIIKFTPSKNGKNNITFISIAKICKKYNLKYNSRCGSIEYHNSENIQIIKTRLYSKILSNNIRNQKFSIKQKSDSLMRKKDQAEKLKKSGNVPDHVLRSLANERIKFDTFICCETIGRMFGATKMTGYNQLSKMVNMGLFSIKKKYIPILKNTTKKEFERLCKDGELFKGKYFFNGNDSSIVKNAGYSIATL